MSVEEEQFLQISVSNLPDQTDHFVKQLHFAVM